MTTLRRLCTFAVLSSALVLGRPAFAETPAANDDATQAVATKEAATNEATTTPPTSKPSPFHADAEVDPTAYVLGGYSLHLGLGYRHVRLDLGAFAMDVPQFVHGNDGFDVAFNGFGAKLHLFPFAEQRGLFLGIDANVSRMAIERRGTDLAVRQDLFGAGVHAGFRIALPAGFYATPWMGVGYTFNTRDVTLGAATYKANPVTFFPAVHLGYRFQ